MDLSIMVTPFRGGRGVDWKMKEEQQKAWTKCEQHTAPRATVTCHTFFSSSARCYARR